MVAAIKAAADDFLHISSDFWHERMTALAERLTRLAPLGEPALAFLCQSGTEAVEGAIKLARYAPYLAQALPGFAEARRKVRARVQAMWAL